MCGRYTLLNHGIPLERQFELFGVPHYRPRYNAAPTELMPVIVRDEEGRRALCEKRWGLIPAWADSIAEGAKRINARSEGVTARAGFRESIVTRRCLVPASGFYEWRRLGKTRQPYLIRDASNNYFGFAGLWSRWQRGPEAIDSFTILTTASCDALRFLHDRMPVILEPDAYAAWLDPGSPWPALEPKLAPFDAGRLVWFPVSSRVNRAGVEDPALVEPASESQLSLFASASEAGPSDA